MTQYVFLHSYCALLRVLIFTSNFRFAEFGTVLEIKDRIMMGNGCSILSTIGMRRFKVLVRKEHDGYDMATVQYIQDEKVPPKKLLGQYISNEILYYFNL